MVSFLGSAYFLMRFWDKKYAESEKKNEENPYIKLSNAKIESDRIFTVYERKVKPTIDHILSFAALILLSPLFGLISIVIYMDDPGPVFFTQKRVGKGGGFFCLHKFRSMKMSTPHDVPTHQLEHPEQYITKVGRVLRKTSLDELPQIWDIFRGKMSIIGPRPALWNQEDLIAERDKYGANDILPGLTGLAQIKGRDELLVPEKAKLDGEYVQVLKQGGMKAFLLDGKLFFETIRSVLCHDGVVEGGTGAMKDADASEAGFENYGCDKQFDIDKTRFLKILITGSGSYIGTSLSQYCSEHYPNIEIDTVDMLDGSWKENCFGVYDTVFHVAGIAHADVGNVSLENQKKYYEVNTDLTIEVCRKCKKEGVKQFIFMSSMIVYGESAALGKKQVIDRYRIPAPVNFYGDSKWRGDVGVRSLQTNEFNVAVLRPPMIYGKGSKGNYPILSKLARRLPVFPEVNNERSMLYIENLCEFVAQLALSGESGIYFPQNGEYGKTSEIVRMIGEEAGRKVKGMKILAPAVKAAGYIPGKIGKMANKAFGNSVYDQRLSIYDGLEYQKVSLRESIKKTEVADRECKSVLILVNHDVVIYNFRLELVEQLLSDGYKVHISSPYGERIDDLIALGAVYHEIVIDRHGMNPVADLKILREYHRLIKTVKPFIILGYTIKPNIYGAIVAKSANIPFVANITGLGMAVENKGIKQCLAVLLYKFAFTSVRRVFFQNKENEQFFMRQKIAPGKHMILPGSGVNLERYSITSFPVCGNGKKDEPIKFAFISRIMKEKGIDQYLNAALAVKKEYPNTEFHICGFCEEEYDGQLKEMNDNGAVIYHGMIKDVACFMSQMHCIIHPTYYPEGLSNVLLEACACGRPIITTDRSGCREVVIEGVNGYIVSEKNTKELIETIKKFIGLSQNEKKNMGIAGRRLVEEKFDRQIVVDKYMNEIKNAV